MKKLSVYKRRSATHKKYENYMRQVQEEYYKATKVLPVKPNLLSLFNDILNASNRAGLEFVLFQPGYQYNKDFYTEITFSFHGQSAMLLTHDHLF